MAQYFRSSFASAASPAEIEIRESISGSLDSAVYKFRASGEKGSQSLQKYMKQELALPNLRLKADFSGDEVDSLANYRVDSHGWFESSTQVDCQWVLEYAFDNRQAIPTNIIKCDLALKRFMPSLRSNLNLSFLVTFCEESRALCNWDNSVGSFEEYAYHLENGFDAYLNYPCTILGI